MAKCRNCGSEDIKIEEDKAILERLNSIETKLAEKTQEKEELAEHLKNCPNCRSVIKNMFVEEEDEEEETDEDEESEEW